jgi:hypothetical protein
MGRRTGTRVEAPPVICEERSDVAIQHLDVPELLHCVRKDEKLTFDTFSFVYKLFLRPSFFQFKIRG